MKKSILLSTFAIMLVMVTGCGKTAKTLTCTLSGEVVAGTTIESEYKVTYTGKYVDLVESKEVVKSDTKEILDAYKQTVESMYEPFKDIKYYDYSVKLDGDTLTSTSTINYSKIDTQKMIEVNSAIGDIVKDGKLELSILQQSYEKMGATCK